MEESDTGRVLDRDLAPVASLIGDPTRIAILAALAEGHALPAGELAHRAGVHPATATAHLRQLVEGGLVSVRAQGRHRYHELAGPQVAAVVEALAQLAPATPVRSLRTDRAFVTHRPCGQESDRGQDLLRPPRGKVRRRIAGPPFGR